MHGKLRIARQTPPIFQKENYPMSDFTSQANEAAEQYLSAVA
jgi:hypothetical protein